MHDIINILRFENDSVNVIDITFTGDMSNVSLERTETCILSFLHVLYVFSWKDNMNGKSSYLPGWIKNYFEG